jgi:hypothetical protein
MDSARARSPIVARLLENVPSKQQRPVRARVWSVAGSAVASSLADTGFADWGKARIS